MALESVRVFMTLTRFFISLAGSGLGVVVVGFDDVVVVAVVDDCWLPEEAVVAGAGVVVYGNFNSGSLNQKTLPCFIQL